MKLGNFDTETIKEKEYQKIIETYAQENGWKVHHCNNTFYCNGGRGFFDLVAVRNGEVILAELKSENGKTSRAQMDWAREYPARELWYPSDAGYVMERMR